MFRLAWMKPLHYCFLDCSLGFARDRRGSDYGTPTIAVLDRFSL